MTTYYKKFQSLQRIKSVEKLKDQI